MVTISCNLDDIRTLVREEVSNAIKNHDAARDVMDSGEVMNYLKLSRVSLWRLNRDKKLVPVKSDGKKHLYRRKDVENYLHGSND